MIKKLLNHTAMSMKKYFTVLLKKRFNLNDLELEINEA